MRSLASFAAAALLVAGVVIYNGHAGLGSSANRIQDGTSNTLMIGASSLILMTDMGGQIRTG
jgi:hypothetical protein